jgi:hypothetical protein
MKKYTLLVVLHFTTFLVFAQGSNEYANGMKFNLNEEGSKYMRFIVWNQIWFRSANMNPGTLVGNEPASTATDIGNRRLRFLTYSQLTPRYMVVIHFGINNQSFTNGGAAGSSGTGGYGTGKKPGLFFHDAWNEYAVVAPEKDKKFSLSVGGGLHYYMGLSRATMASTLNFLTLDAPIFNWPLIENSDQFARQMGLFAKGKYGKLEYRLSHNKPFATNVAPINANNAENAIAVDNNGNAKWATAGYFEYQFLETESNLLPFKVGSYVGTKKVFNVGAGFYNAPNATKSLVNNQIQKHAMNLFAADVFLDLPIGKKEKKMAITAYSVYYNYDFGPNYLRNIGIMNIGTSDPSFIGNRPISGVGNSQPTIGTGTIWYTQAGFLIPDKKEKPKVRIQPFGAFTYKDFEALRKSSTQLDIGSNFLLDGQHAKITAQYSTRPVYSAIGTKESSKGEFIVQLQIYL